MDLKDMIFALMMMDFDERGIGEITTDVRDSIVDKIVELAKARNEIKGLKADREILSKNVGYHNCNTCKRECDFRPEPGENTRSNCFGWYGKDGDEQ